MCNLCQRLEAIKTIDSTPLKPMIKLITKLHEKLEPGLGDVLLRREELVLKIRRRLLPLQTGLLKSLIGGIISDLDAELQRIEERKVDHPAAWSVGKLDRLKEKMGPGESSSVRMRMRMVKQREMKGKVGMRGVDIGGDTQNEEEQGFELFYEAEPPTENIEYSKQVVEEWFANHGEAFLGEGASEYRFRPYRHLRGGKKCTDDVIGERF